LSGARFILVVEKDAIFQRLVEDRLFDAVPCVLITGRGMPDIASRWAALQQLQGFERFGLLYTFFMAEQPVGRDGQMDAVDSSYFVRVVCFLLELALLYTATRLALAVDHLRHYHYLRSQVNCHHHHHPIKP
jgi:hypothetical protein